MKTLCPRGIVIRGQETLLAVGLGMWATCPYTKSPETRANLSVSGRGELDKLHWHETPTWFVSCVYFWLELAQADDVIPGCCPAIIKAPGEIPGKHHGECMVKVLPTLGANGTSVQCGTRHQAHRRGPWQGRGPGTMLEDCWGCQHLVREWGWATTLPLCPAV